MLEDLDPRSMLGLAETIAADRLKQQGYNELPACQKRQIWLIAWEIVQDPIFLLLVACGAIYLVLGDLQEAIILLGFVFLIMGISLYQETKADPRSPTRPSQSTGLCDSS